MSQADDAHRAETEARLGNLVFVVGIALYVTALAVCYAVLGIDSERGGQAFGVLVAAPLAFIAIIFILMQVVVFAGLLSSTPYMSWAYGLSVVRRDWKTVVGVILVLTVFCAIFATLTT